MGSRIGSRFGVQKGVHVLSTPLQHAVTGDDAMLKINNDNHQLISKKKDL